MNFLGELKYSRQSRLVFIFSSSALFGLSVEGFVLDGSESVCGSGCRPESSNATHLSHANCQRGHVSEQHGQFCAGNAPSSGSKSTSFRLQEEGGGGKRTESGHGEGGGHEEECLLGRDTDRVGKGGGG